MEVREGYKESDIGVIPNDWNSNELGYYLSFISYGFTNPMPTLSEGIYMITANDINDGRIKFETARKTSEIAYTKLLTDKSRPKCNDILLTKDGTLGRLALLGNERICINQSVAVLRPNNRVCPLFLKLLLESPLYQKTMIDNAGGSTIKHIYISIIDKMEIAVPPTLQEQTAIATALSDTDALISSLEKLIAKKRNIKQGAMQELLKPKKGWEVKRLGDIGSVIRGASPRPQGDKRYYGGSVPRLMVEDVTRDGKYVTPKVDFLTDEGAKKSRPCKNGTLTIVCSGTVGVVSILAVDACIHDGFLALVDIKNGYSTDFLYHKLSTLRTQFDSTATHGGIFTNLTTSSIRDFQTSFPPFELQNETAKILSDMDSEINLLESQLEKYRQIKSGMMQNLLTGKIRLI